MPTSSRPRSAINGASSALSSSSFMVTPKGSHLQKSEKKNGHEAHSVVRRCLASQHRQDALPARTSTGDASGFAERKGHAKWPFPKTLVAGVGFEPTTFGL